MTRVLAVDDEPALLRGLAVNLRARGYEVDTAATGEAALELAELHPPNAVILDLGLPGISGFDVIKDLRGWSETPIIVLSALADQADKVHALDVGADDYVTKPFGMDELLARLRAVLRRTSSTAAGLVVRTDDFTLDFGAKTARSDHRDVRLTPTEWRIVEVLVAPRRPARHQRTVAAVRVGPGRRRSGQHVARPPGADTAQARAHPVAPQRTSSPKSASATASSRRSSDHG